MMSDKNYALIKDGYVVNIVVWNGDGDIFSDFTTTEITDEFTAAIGDAYSNGILYGKPRDGYEYIFSTEAQQWIITAEGATAKATAVAAARLDSALSEYDRASDKITTLQQQIDDEDYSDTNTSEKIAAEKSTWVAYRKALRAYIASGNGEKTPPTQPDPQ